LLFEYNNEHTDKDLRLITKDVSRLTRPFFMQNTQTVVQKHITGFTITFVWRSKQVFLKLQSG